MDACLMAVQLWADCIAPGTEPPVGMTQVSKAAIAPMDPASTTRGVPPAAPETLAQVAPSPRRSLACPVWNRQIDPTTSNPLACPMATQETTAGANSHRPEPRSALGSQPTSASADSGFPLSLPLHPEETPSPRPPIPPQSVVPNPPPRAMPTAMPAQISRLAPPTPQPTWAPQPRPTNGSQMYRFRQAALGAGQLFTRIPPQRYVNQWQGGGEAPTYSQWRSLLAREAAVMANAQGSNRLTLVIGDSLALWLPADTLPQNRFWLNQSISGETTGHIRQRLPDFADTRPDTIHLMAGINDLRQGATDGDVVQNINQILLHLRQQHPQARVILHSILPTRLESLPRDRIALINRHLAYVANQRGADFLDLQATFTDDQGQLRRELTTDGLHLSRQGYAIWQAALLSY